MAHWSLAVRIEIIVSAHCTIINSENLPITFRMCVFAHIYVYVWLWMEDVCKTYIQIPTESKFPQICLRSLMLMIAATKDNVECVLCPIVGAPIMGVRLIAKRYALSASIFRRRGATTKSCASIWMDVRADVWCGICECVSRDVCWNGIRETFQGVQLVWRASAFSGYILDCLVMFAGRLLYFIIIEWVVCYV